MSGSVNKVILVGHLGADVEVRHTQDGKPIANLRIATSESWRDRNSGDRKERTEWHRVVIFSEGLCKIAEQYLRKGSHVYLEGQLQTRKWEDQSGNERYSTEVVLQGFNSTLTMLDSRESRPSEDTQLFENQRDAVDRFERDTGVPSKYGDEMDSEIPF